jgi:hypothetical protein
LGAGALIIVVALGVAAFQAFLSGAKNVYVPGGMGIVGLLLIVRGALKIIHG